MSEDLGISETQYPMLITIFFIAYFIWEVPSNLILTRCPRPSLYLSALMLVSELHMGFCVYFLSNFLSRLSDLGRDRSRHE